ncbi:MAG TPA: DUF664 domain-containing protein [Gemmatimonadales bacterium]|jgi:uncharacterized damage-inducible protein DinB
MLVAAVAAILDRDLQALAREVAAYPDERALWETPPGITNSGGRLAVHLAGNIRHYLGAKLGGTGYLRDRPAEFTARDVPRATILAQIEEARAAVRAAAARTADERLGEDYPEVIAGVRVATGEFLIHLVAHFDYHLGQLDYHRRVVTGQTGGVNAVRTVELSTARPVPD